MNKKGLCHGCGACYVICPNNAITMGNKGKNNFPYLNKNCTDCGLCNKVCSGRYNDVTKSYFFTVLDSGKHIYIAYSTNESVRNIGSSGGFITQYLLELFENKIIEGAIVAKSDGSLAGTKAAIALTKEQIIAASGSKYYPVSSCSALKEIVQNKKYAFVGKGCDLSSLNMLQKEIPMLKEAICIKIGLMCHHTPYAFASKKLFEAYGMNYSSECKILYRDHGWPGKTVLSKQGDKKVIDYKKMWGQYLGKFSNTPYRCVICTDSFAEDADIVIGDPWGLNPELENQQNGLSLVLAYTNRGIAEIEKLKNNQHFNIKNADKKMLLSSQFNLIKKQEAAYYKLFFLNLFYVDTSFGHIKFIDNLKVFCKLIKARGFNIRFMFGALKFALCKRVKLR